MEFEERHYGDEEDEEGRDSYCEREGTREGVEAVGDFAEDQFREDGG